MRANHIFIVSEDEGREADELVSVGICEGSSRIHRGQGTRNRKFYFENFFLEIIWMYCESEIKNEGTRETGLWERIQYRKSGYSPFGICLDYEQDSLDLPSDIYVYRPDYLPEGHAFKIIKNTTAPWLPWICWLPDLSDSNRHSEPIDHKIGVRTLSGIRIGIPHDGFQNSLIERIASESNIIFEKMETNRLILEFDHRIRRKTLHFRTLPLTINY